MSEKPESESPKPGLASIVLSTLAAAFGVQSSKQREQDFKHGNFKAFIIAGILFTALFVLTIITIARLALNA